MSGRRTPFTLGKQLRLVTPLVLLWWVGSLVVAVASLSGSISVEQLLVDPQTLADMPWYAGAVSDIGLICWAVATTAGIIGGWVSFQTGRPSAGKFLLAGGGVSALLTINDMFLIHNRVPTLIAGMLIVAPVVAWIFAFSNEVMRTRWLILALTLIAFEVGIVANRVWNEAGDLDVLEHGATFLGVLAWALYFVLTTRDIMRSTIRAAMTDDPVVVPGGDKVAGHQLPTPEPAL